jgi:hypothetical protein
MFHRLSSSPLTSSPSSSSSEALPEAPLALPTTTSSSSSSVDQDLSAKFHPADYSTFTTTGYTNNVNSMYMQDADASIAIHHHHFTKSALPTRKPTHTTLQSKSLHAIRNEEPTIPKHSVATEPIQKPYQSDKTFLVTNQVTTLKSKSTEKINFDDGEPNFYNLKSSTLYRANHHRCKRPVTIYGNFSKQPTPVNQISVNSSTRSIKEETDIYWPLHLRTKYQYKGYLNPTNKISSQISALFSSLLFFVFFLF